MEGKIIRSYCRLEICGYVVVYQKDIKKTIVYFFIVLKISTFTNPTFIETILKISDESTNIFSSLHKKICYIFHCLRIIFSSIYKALAQTRLEFQIQLSRALMEERAQKELAVQHALASSKGDLQEKIDSVTVVGCVQNDL